MQDILRKFWGYDSFRPMQEDIISSVMTGQDVLALMPTGGGKSICYQVPAMAKEGICIVISPLIALMRDQVANLQARGIRALAIYTGMSRREIDTALENAIHGNFKFLYVSPERLHTDIFKARVHRMKVSLLAVDEAHCVSEWGYDFRPSYLRIAEARELFPGVPMIALTATATPRVRQDMTEKLGLKPGAQTFVQSFDRPNLVYGVLEEENKYDRLAQLLRQVPGTGIVYASTRMQTKTVAAELQRRGITADFYHGGLELPERNRKQEAWMQGRVRVMAATNAFGLGIDKPDVRLVAHFELPDSLEAYYQEAGRAGRDGQRSFALALFNPHDAAELKHRAETSLPTAEEVKTVYHTLGNFFQLPVGAGLGQTFSFHMSEFLHRYNMKSVKTFQALRTLERAGYISVSEAVYLPARLRVITDNHTLYAFEVANKAYEPLIKAVLRSYGGCFEDYVQISETQLARRCNLDARTVEKQLNELTKYDLIDYRPASSAPQLTLLTERLSKGNLILDGKEMQMRRTILEEKTAAILGYAGAKGRCRGKLLLRYFGEEREEDCGHCDYCLKEKQSGKEGRAADAMETAIIEKLSEKPHTLEELATAWEGIQEKDLLKLLRRLIDENQVRWKDTQYLEVVR